MRKYPRPVLQEWMIDMGGGGMSSHSEADRIMDTINGANVQTQKAVLDSILKKYFNTTETELVEILTASHPEKLL
jgi:hypothetical protein